MKIRTRMAPSPTGEYHLGHIRTVLFNYALARQNGGQFIIRIEDTDRERFVEGATDRIMDTIKNYGLDWDEGPRVGGPYEPYFQSQRLDLYKKYALELIENKHAYYCFCTPERLAALRDEQRKQKMPTTKYDRYCLKLSEEEVSKNLSENMRYVIRLKVPDNETITFHDEVIGDVSVNSNDLDDQVLLKSDGFPTYQLAVVIDDHLMKITHVMRGTDWIPSTPKHVLLYKYFGWEMPKHIHLPNLKDVGGSKKFSKRFGAREAAAFLREGYLPRAVINFLMFLGWHPSGDKEIFTLAEFVKEFSLDRLQKTDMVAADPEKLDWYNAYYIRNTQTNPLWHEIKSWAKKYDVVLNGISFQDDFNVKVLELVKDRMQTLADYNLLTHFFFIPPVIDQKVLCSYAGNKERATEILNKFHLLFSSVNESNWTAADLDKISHKMIETNDYTPKEAFMTLRVAITGETSTPPIFDIIGILGKVDILDRIKSAVK